MAATAYLPVINFRQELLISLETCYQIAYVFKDQDFPLPVTKSELRGVLFEFSQQWKPEAEKYYTYHGWSGIMAGYLLNGEEREFFGRTLSLRWVPMHTNNPGPAVGNYRGLTLYTWGKDPYTKDAVDIDKKAFESALVGMNYEG